MNNETRFLKHVKKIGDCWIWTATQSHNGYGLFYYQEKMKFAHRCAFQIFKEKIPHKMSVRQTCKNRLCVNPDHLEVFAQRGSEHHCSVLSAEEVHTIKDLLSLRVPQRDIAKSFGVSVPTISHIATNRTWVHV